MIKVAIYGKGGIGKSTVTSNLSAALASLGKRVIQIGCDPKADSTANLLSGNPVMPVMNYMREHDEEPTSLDQITREGFGGVLCIETGGPTPGLGCAGRGIITTFSLLEELELFEKYKPSVVVNLAAQAGVRYSIINPSAYIESNITGFFNILEACRHSYDDSQPGVEHLVYASSSSVYGSNKKVPYSTDDNVDNPVSL